MLLAERHYGLSFQTIGERRKRSRPKSKNKAVLRAIMNLCTTLEVKSGVGLCTVMISYLFVRWRIFRSGCTK